MFTLEDWDRARRELSELIGEVTMFTAEIEASLDLLITELLVVAPRREFFPGDFLRHWNLARKVETLTSCVAAFRDDFTDADLAISHLRDIKRLGEERNRLVHDLHDVDFVEGHITRRRLWEKEGRPIDLESYRELAGRTALVTGPVIDGIFECLRPAGTPPDRGYDGVEDEDEAVE